MKKAARSLFIVILALVIFVGANVTAFAEDKANQDAGNVFSDVNADHWFYADVMQVYEDGLMTGYGDSDLFGPYDNLSRAQFAVILYRREGSPNVDYYQAFPDVAPDKWYTKACIWANNNGLITGYENGYFGIADNITREQVATILYRYAAKKGQDTSQRTNLYCFADFKNTSSWALEAVNWCVATGIIQGKDENTRLDPLGSTLRCECAALLNRFKQNEINPAPQGETFKYFAIGNSIAIHGTTSHWWNECGMAASSADKDYYHIVRTWLSKTKGVVSSNVINFNAWEREYYDRAANLSTLDRYLSADLDLVTIQLGENANETSTFQSDLIELVQYIKARAPMAQIILVDNFWTNPDATNAKWNVASWYGCGYASLYAIRDVPYYQCGLGTAVYDAYGYVHYVDDDGVAIHPGDAGMQYIANAIIDQIK